MTLALLIKSGSQLKGCCLVYQELDRSMDFSNFLQQISIKFRSVGNGSRQNLNFFLLPDVSNCVKSSGKFFFPHAAL